MIIIIQIGSKLFLFLNEVHLHVNSGMRLLLELYCVVVIKHVPVYLWTFTLLFSGVVVVLDLNKKRHGSADLHDPIHPPPDCSVQVALYSKKSPCTSTSQYLLANIYIGLIK